MVKPDVSLDSTQRFSERVENYVRFRPGYPGAVLDWLRAHAGLRSEDVIADIGSGTGILTGLFLRHGNTVFAVEPNAAMRAAADRLLAQFPRYHSVNGTAEQTTLATSSADAAAAGQAFHWFDLGTARQEAQRILRPGGWAAILWNTRSLDATAFLREYETLLRRYATDYDTIDHRNVTRDTLRPFFGGPFEYVTFPNAQHLDYEGLKGRLLSASYMPGPGQPGHEAMLRDLRTLYEAHAQEGRVHLLYDTELYCGALR
ncbi:MAG: class I SAM-dependent methyltransferase [Candidatus Hydrogenedentes bacterium]|nr:class I SAM-dependent methyltransferase [Candidatus Hydrogenedentota bacterium]